MMALGLALLIRRFAPFGTALAMLVAGPAFVSDAHAAPSPESQSMMCEQAMQAASVRHDVPLRLLRAVSVTESGRRVGGARRPWPWTTNIDGKGRYFDSRAEAEANLRAKRRAGARMIDVGCFQLNHYWHGEAFDSIEHMFDPEANADYAARFLASLMAETGDWMRAAGYYHSRTPEHYQRYSALIARAYASADGGTRIAAPAAITPAPGVQIAAAPPPRLAPRQSVAKPLQAPPLSVIPPADAIASKPDAPNFAEAFRPIEAAPSWRGLLRLARADTQAPAAPISAGGVAISLTAAGQPMLRDAKPLF